MNSARMMRSGMTKKAARHGNRQQQREFDRAVLRVRGARCRRRRRCRRDISGSITVPAAMPMTPIGS